MAEPKVPLTSTAKLDEIHRLTLSQFRPEPVVFYKPKPAGGGVAAKFNLRVQPQFDAAEGFLTDVSGGLFVDLVAQGDKNPGGFPTFKWMDRETLVTAKLGLPDVSGLLAAVRDFRSRGVEVPTYLRGKDGKPNVVSLFHKTEATGSTILTYSFLPETSVFQVSKSKALQRSISLTLGEEVVLEAYLQLALQAFMRAGLR